jgi:hypothetical protein
MGKDLQRDASASEATLVALLGVEGSRRRLRELQNSALAHLQNLEADDAVLRAAFKFVISRTN